MANQTQLTLENVRIIYPNFAGRESEYNTKGSREFALALDPELGQELASQGLNVKFPTEDQPNRPVYLPVTLSNGPEIQPWIKIVLVNNGNGTIINPTDVSQIIMLDEVTAGARANVIVNPYNWSTAGRTGIKAYINKLYIYIDDIDETLAPAKDKFEQDINFL
nr:MAG TPA: hypothetical protein [Caudoviricetes sp.]